MRVQTALQSVYLLCSFLFVSLFLFSFPSFFFLFSPLFLLFLLTTSFLFFLLLKLLLFFTFFLFSIWRGFKNNGKLFNIWTMFNRKQEFSWKLWRNYVRLFSKFRVKLISVLIIFQTTSCFGSPHPGEDSWKIRHIPSVRQIIYSLLKSNNFF